MIPGITAAGLKGTPDAQLRAASKALEGVFIAQLYQAMRKTVPDGGLIDTGNSGEIFTQMFDEHMADTLAQRMSGGLGDRMYEQLRSQFGVGFVGEPGAGDHD